MLRLIKKHVAACPKSSETDWKCSPKVRCPFYIVGPHPVNPTGPRIKKHAGTSDERVAKAFLFEFERALHDPKPEAPPQVLLTEAVELYLAAKRHCSRSRQAKLRLQLSRMVGFLGNVAVTSVSNTDLQRWCQTWEAGYLTLRASRENLKGFWNYCFTSDITPKNIAAALPTIGDPRAHRARRIPTLTPEEVEAILTTAANCDELFRRNGDGVAAQVRAFTLVQRYTGLAISDVTKLRLDEVNGNRIRVNRLKTGADVWSTVPPVVAEALTSFSPDGREHFFWSGGGDLHARVGTWGQRLQKLYVLSGVRVTETVKRRKSGGKLKATPEAVKVSAVTPHFWRHTFVRDLYLQDFPLETIADLLGDDVQTLRAYYSSFDELKQQRLTGRLEAMWEADSLTQKLSR